MSTEFCATSAQVIPTLLIVGVIEWPRVAGSTSAAVTNLMRSAVCLSVLGEAAALAYLYRGGGTGSLPALALLGDLAALDIALLPVLAMLLPTHLTSRVDHVAAVVGALVLVAEAVTALAL